MSHSTVFNKKTKQKKNPAQIICEISQVYIHFDLHASLKGLNHKIKTDINMMSLQNQDRYINTLSMNKSEQKTFHVDFV